MLHPPRIAAVVTALTTLALGACAASTQGTAASPAAPALTLVDGWCKSTDSMPEGYKDMTGCFGTLKNAGSTDLVIASGASPAAAMVEMHETIKASDGTMKMQPATAGFTIKAGGSFELKPGANHVMLMKISKPLAIGDSVPVTLKTGTGEVAVTFQARAFDAANETYKPAQ